MKLRTKSIQNQAHNTMRLDCVLILIKEMNFTQEQHKKAGSRLKFRPKDERLM